MKTMCDTNVIIDILLEREPFVEDSYKILKLFVFQKKAKDIEDCLVAACAKSIHCDYIAARNKKDFEGFGISVLTPTEILLKII